MRVTFEEDATVDFAAIVSDEDFSNLVSIISDNRLARVVVGAVLAAFKRPSVQPDGVTKMISHFAKQHHSTPTELDQLCSEVGPLLAGLYQRHHAGRVRGAVVEHLVLEALRPRYGENNLDDNVFVLLDETAYRSSRSVDVAGWDGNVGECHDCKTRSRSFDLDFARNLEQNLPPEHFRIGLVSTDSEAVTAGQLAARGYSPASHTRVIALEQLWDIVPLQPGRRAA